MAIEQFILDESNREKREKALGRPLKDYEEPLADKEDIKLHAILGESKNEKLYGELLQSMYGDEAEGLFERLASEDASLEDLKKLNKARYEFQSRMTYADTLRAGLHDGDIRQLAGRSEDFDAIAGVLNDDKRTAEIIRDHFYRLAMQGDTDTLQKIQEAQTALKRARASPEYKKYDQLATAFIKRYGFTTQQWSDIESSHHSLSERKELEADIWSTLSAFQKVRSWLFGSPPNLAPGLLGFLDPLRTQTKRRISDEQEAAKKEIREHLTRRKEWFVGQKTKSIVRQIGQLEDLSIGDTLKEQFAALGNVLAASVSKDKRLLQALVREAKSQGAEKAEALDTSKPLTFADVKASQGQLTEANYKNAFKDYLKRRRASGLDTRDLSDPDKLGEIDSFHGQYGRTKNPGVFARILEALMRTFSNQNKSLLMDDAAWA